MPNANVQIRRRRGRPRDPGLDEALVAAALDLLAEVGFARLTMDQVAARAGVGKASLYLRWPNKVALVAEAIQHRSAVVPDVPDTGRLGDDVRTFLLELLRTRPAGAQALAAVSGEIGSNAELREAWRRGVFGALTGALRAIVERGVRRGELPAGTDIELLAMAPMALLQNWRLEHDEAPDRAVVERIVAQLFASHI